MQALQADVGLLDAQYFAPKIIAAFENSHSEDADPALAAAGSDLRLSQVIDNLRAWDGLDYQAKTGIPQGFDSEDADGNPLVSLNADEILASRATAVYSMWRTQMIKSTIDATLNAMGLGDYNPGSSQAVTALKNLVEMADNPLQAWTSSTVAHNHKPRMFRS